MKTSLFILVLFLPGWFALAQAGDSTVTIAVLTLEGKGVPVQEAEILTERLRSALVGVNHYQIVERTQMETIMREQGFRQAGCVSNECMVEAGRILGVRQMVGGMVGKIGSSYTLDIRLFDIETTEIVRVVTRNHQGSIENLLPLIEDVARELAGEKPAPTTPTQSPDKPGELSLVTNHIIDSFERFKHRLARSDKFDLPSWRHHNNSWTPFQFSFIYPEQLFSSKVDVFGVRFNLIYGKNRNVFGWDIGLINEIDNDLFGFQWGIYNIGETIYGIQYGLLNTSRTVYGIQIGLINVCDQLTGIQIGVLNFHTRGQSFPFFPIINIGF
ncbi:MAG: hypothetical protein GXO92_06805 [FCB group bacterium]|nr:hypothetical protein [FCB group bacterium]